MAMGQLKQCLFQKNLNQNYCALATEDYKELLDSAVFGFFFFLHLYITCLNHIRNAN